MTHPFGRREDDPRTDAAVVVTEAVFHQPTGTFTAKKK